MAKITGQVLDLPGLETFRQDVLTGLRKARKTIPCKYFYDEHGSQLFERITELDEYYLTRTEAAIMREHAAAMARLLGPGCLLIEYGSGSSAKTRILLDHLAEPAGYVPIDISTEHLLGSVARLEEEYPDLAILPVVADFTTQFELPETDAPVRRKAVYFPGSTLGNFYPEEAREFLERITKVVGPGGALLVGVDLRKEVEIVEAAYNDRKGATAAFNLNLLRRINRELDADFDLDRFEHRAPYNDDQHRIEMLLVSRCDQTVRIGDERVSFRASESILTECSYKYSLAAFEELAHSTGFEVGQVWTDDDRLFSAQYLVVP